MKRKRTAKPQWLVKPIEQGAALRHVRSVLDGCKLHTVCEEARCPNRGECYASGTATFMILGDRCTRNCRFCAVSHDVPLPLDPDEPRRVAEAVKKLGLTYAVITSVTRDDLPDGGANHFAVTINSIRNINPETGIEVLIPDFRGSTEALNIVCEAEPEVLAHNIETVPRLYADIRPNADYTKSLSVLKKTKERHPGIITKSGLMLGLGETGGEIRQVFDDLLDHGCSFLTMGQYLQPDTVLVPVERFLTPDEFDCWKEEALRAGFSQVASGPLVRSSYKAEELYCLFIKLTPHK